MLDCVQHFHKLDTTLSSDVTFDLMKKSCDLVIFVLARSRESFQKIITSREHHFPAPLSFLMKNRKKPISHSACSGVEEGTLKCF